MKPHFAFALVLAAALAAGCAEMGTLGGSQYGETSGTVAGQSDRLGRIIGVEVVQVADNYRLGIGTAVGAVAGALLGSQIGSGRGATAATIGGAAVGAAAGTYAESRYKKQDAQRVVVQMSTGGQVTIVQPIDNRLGNGMYVRVDGSGETARVVPR
jgi:outer membrane lipoprotein SlyB